MPTTLWLGPMTIEVSHSSPRLEIAATPTSDRPPSSPLSSAELPATAGYPVNATRAPRLVGAGRLVQLTASVRTAIRPAVVRATYTGVS